MVDIAPTLLDLVGLSVPDEMEGVSVVECWSGQPCSTREEWWAYGLNHETNGLTSIAGYRWPYKWMWRRSLGRRAHLVSGDPWEEEDLLEGRGDNPDELKALAEKFRQKRRRFAQLLRLPPRMQQQEKHIDLLRSLGYIEAK
jgi:arylsulfatase A-like enzyme